jgi:hypothetical protein
LVRVIKIENEMGGACSAYREGRGESCKGVWGRKKRERDHLGDPGADGTIILS